MTLEKASGNNKITIEMIKYMVQIGMDVLEIMNLLIRIKISQKIRNQD